MPRRTPRTAVAVALGLAAAPLLALAGPAPAALADVGVSVTTLHFKVATGTANRLCDVVGDLYVPAGVTASTPAPAILTTNGFGGSKDDGKTYADGLAQRGYVTLSYSGLGFGGSGCPISDDDPDTDGRAASQLISFLGGATGIAYRSFDPLSGWSGDVPALDLIKRDAVAHDGVARPNDPRVGMIGGSYGGQIQFAAAGDDPRMDTIIPLITWNELSYSLAPGNGGVNDGSVQAGLPGVAKRQWDSFFFALGMTAFPRQKLGEPVPSPTQLATDAMCPGFLPATCAAQVVGATRGYLDAPGSEFFHHSSVASYLDRITIPVLLGQGQADTLFNLQEATATYTSLRSRGVPVKMMWQSWGHSRIGPAAGELPNPLIPGDPTKLLDTFQGQAFAAWFDHYLKDSGPTPALDFEYFRPWAFAAGGGADRAAAAYGTAPSYPVGVPVRLQLSGTDALLPAGSTVASGAAALTTPAQGAATSYSETSVVGIARSYSDGDPQPAPFDVPGGAASWNSAPLSADTDVVGIPTVDLTVSAPAVATQQGADPGTHLVLFAKLYDVGPDGALELPERLVSPVRVADVGKPLHIALPGIVHRFAKGHSLRLTVAGSDAAYSGNAQPFAVTFPTSAGSPGVLTLPVLGVAPASTTTPVVTPAKQATHKAGTTGKRSAVKRPVVRPVAVQPKRTLAFTGLPTLLPTLAAALLGAALVLRRRRSTS